MQLRTIYCILLLGLGLLPGVVCAQDCSGLPTSFTGNEFPTGDFFTNFNNPCYAISFATGKGMFGYGDLNSIYNIIYFKVSSAYQLIIVGSFPQARYFSITAYDEHSSIGQFISDVNIMPLTSQYVNPFQPGVPYVSGQQYAVPVNFGGTPGTLETGCMMNGYNVQGNALDATQRHIGMDWNSDAGFYRKYPNVVHHVVDTAQHSNPNTAGTLLIRNYIDDSPVNSSTLPYIIVRDVRSGCAYPAAYVMSTIGIVTTDGTVGRSWQANMQVQAHTLYETSYLPKLCFQADHSNKLMWLRSPDFVPGRNPDAGYITANVPANLPATLASAGQVMRVRFRLPSFPPIPCTNGCTRDGTEQMRYTSLSFGAPNGLTLASVADSNFTPDKNGFVTLIVGTGATIPSWITAANGYTFLDLTAIANYQQLDLMSIRHILPATTFDCSADILPYRTLEYSPTGGLMDEYVPLVDYPVAASLPTLAGEVAVHNSCAIYPNGQPGVEPACGVFKPPAATISSAVTQCSAPGCNSFVAQPLAPVTITGAGFGSFPLGLPFIGASNYLAIHDTTQNWDAGYGTDACNIYLDSWASNRISLVLDWNQNPACPLIAGDQLTVSVWNPQAAAGTKPATFNVTVKAN